MKANLDASSYLDTLIPMNQLSHSSLSEWEEPYSENQMSEFPPLEGEIEYNEKSRLPLRKLAILLLKELPWVQHDLERDLPADCPADIATAHPLLKNVFHCWEKAGRPTGQKWVEVFFEYLQRGREGNSQGVR